MNPSSPVNLADDAPASADQAMPWGAVLSMALCAFALVASEFMPVSLLTPIARDLTLTEGQAGQAIAISGLFALLTSLFIARASAGLDRKAVLLSLTLLMACSGVMVAFAPNYPVLMIGRALLGIAIGGCWSMSTAVVMRMAPGRFVPRSIAIIQGGSALATAIAAPMGSYIGAFIGWRGAFFCVVPLALIALAWQAFSLPALPDRRRGTSDAGALALLLRPKIAVAMIAIAFLFSGQFALFTYLRPFMEVTTGVDVATLSALLLLMGTAGLLGTMVIGPIVAKSLYGPLLVIPLIMAAIATGMVAFGSAVGSFAVLIGLWGFVSTPAPVGWFTWLSRALPEDAEAGGGLTVAVIQLAITIGATTGGLVYDSAGAATTFLFSAMVLVLAAALVVFTARASRR